MRRAVFLLTAPLLLAACHKEPDFEERYHKAAEEIEARAKAMDADIAKSDRVVSGGAAAAPKDLPQVAQPSNAPMSSGE